MRRTAKRDGVIEIGVISDTHGLVRESALAALRGVAHVVHAGDVGSPEVLAALAEVAPVTAVRGNNDLGAWARRLPERATFELAGARLLVVHDRKELRPDATAGFDVVVSGHSHRPLAESVDGTLFLNPGSAGPRRFTLPVSLARLSLSRGEVRCRLLTLE